MWMETKDQLPYINEIHYDNVGADANEGVEVAVRAFDTDVYVIVLYDANSFYASHRSDNTSVATISAPDTNGIKYIVFRVPIPYDGPTGAIYLRIPGAASYLEGLSYEGTVFPDIETDIGVLEDGNGPSTFSLQRRIGCAVWDVPRTSTFGAANVATSACPTKMPTRPPTKKPTRAPTKMPTKSPTKMPTRAPTKMPTKSPTKMPTRAPTKMPTKSPTKMPTRAPTKMPTRAPTKMPTKSPTKQPTASPTKMPTKSPTKMPTRAPTKMPTKSLTKQPTASPTKMPTQKPTNRPVKEPTKAPVKVNTTAPVVVPTDAPVRKPCGFLNLSIFCPLTGCGVIGRAIGLCN